MKENRSPFRARESEAIREFSSQGSPEVRTLLLVENADFIVVSFVQIVLPRNILVIRPH